MCSRLDTYFLLAPSKHGSRRSFAQRTIAPDRRTQEDWVDGIATPCGFVECIFQGDSVTVMSNKGTSYFKKETSFKPVLRVSGIHMKADEVFSDDPTSFSVHGKRGLDFA